VTNRSGTLFAAAVLLCGLCGCGRDRTLAACEATERYATATSAPPVQIPDDLSPPDETDSLRLPAVEGGASAVPRPCLETPPGFYAEGAPGGTRLGIAPARPAPQPAAAESPAPPASSPAEDADRRIDN
jgi:hypothetical protein